MKRLASVVVVIPLMLPSISLAVPQDETAAPDEGTAAEQTQHGSRNEWRKLPACDATISRKLEAYATEKSDRYFSNQSRNGVTVRIEKVTLERVMDGPAWFRKAYGPDWQKYVTSDLRTDSCSFRIVRIFVSVSGSVKKQALSCEFSRDQSRMDGVAEFGARGWRRQLPDMDVDPEVRGLIFWAIIKGDATIEQLFPGEVKLDVTTERGEKATFKFADLAL
jgi:hypothetical protein